jgi:hypothetical protein
MANRLIVHVTMCGFALFLILMTGVVSLATGSAAARDQTGTASTEENAGQENATPAVDCRELATLIRQQKSLISREAGQLKREIAALRTDLSNPGMKEIFAGIGYIFGLAGIGLYFQSRGRAGK